MNQLEKIMIINSIAPACDAEQKKRKLEIGNNFTEEQAQEIAREIIDEILRDENFSSMKELVSNAFDSVMG